MKRDPTDYTLEEFAQAVGNTETYIKTLGPPDYTEFLGGRWTWFYRKENVQSFIEATADAIRSAWGYLPANKQGGER
ncbi:MAG: hypothetical protein K0B16_08455 [Burkholderiaceae bacterium]|nr:hypothetical protein [Burkholderiaceae bacterium]